MNSIDRYNANSKYQLLRCENRVEHGQKLEVRTYQRVYSIKWRVTRGVATFFAITFSLGLALLIKNVAWTWKASVTGKGRQVEGVKEIFHKTTSPNNTASNKKAAKVPAVVKKTLVPVVSPVITIPAINKPIQELAGHFSGRINAAAKAVSVVLDEDSSAEAIQVVSDAVIPAKLGVKRAKSDVQKTAKSVNERIEDAHDAVMVRLNEHITVVRIQTVVRKRFLRNKPTALRLSAFQDALRELERADPQLIINGTYDKMIDACIEHCSIMENRVGLQRLTAYVMGSAIQFYVKDGDKELQAQKDLYATKGELLKHLLYLPEVPARDFAFVLRDTFGMVREFSNKNQLETNLTEVLAPDSSLWLASDEQTASPIEEEAKNELRELQGDDIFAQLIRTKVSPREQQLHDLLDKAKEERQKQVIGKVRRVQHGGGLYYLKAWSSGLRRGYPLANGRGLGIWVHPKKVDESLGKDITALTHSYSNRAHEWFDMPAALTATVAAEHVLSTGRTWEGTITTKDRVRLRKPLSHGEGNLKEKEFASETEKNHVLKALRVNSLPDIDWQKGPAITDASGRLKTDLEQVHGLEKALDLIYGSEQDLVKRIKGLLADERELELQTPDHAYDLLNLKYRNLASFWMLRILHDEHGLSWDELGGSKLHALLQKNASPDLYAFI